MKIGDHEVHDLAALLPLMEGKPFEELVQDVTEHGLRDPIVLLPAIHRDPEMILDGRNRLRACLEAGRKPRFVYYRESTDLASLIEYVRSQNLRRRHLSPTQIANAGLMFDDWYRDAAKSRMRNGGAIGGRSRRRGSADLRDPCAGKSSAALADGLGVSARTVENVRRARKLGTPEVVAAMAGGELSGDTAKDLVRLEPDDQDDALSESRRTGQSVRSLVKEKLAAPEAPSKPASDVEAAQVAVIVVHHTSRFSRDATEARVVKRTLRKAGVRVLSVCQDIHDDPIGRLVEGIFECIDEYESDANGIRTAASLDELVRQGFFPGRRPPYRKHSCYGQRWK